MTDHSPLISLPGRTPQVADSAWIAPTAAVIGAVTIGEGSGVFYSAVVRGDTSTITIGAGSNLQDGVVVHADPDDYTSQPAGNAGSRIACGVIR